jgi:uncharacterized protein YbaA (DUF1428 family)
VPTANQTAYGEHAAEASAVLRQFGVTRMVEAWVDNVPHGKVTDFRRAVQAKAEERVVFAWIEWPSKARREAGWNGFRAEQPMDQVRMPFDAQRMIYGGFLPSLVA